MAILQFPVRAAVIGAGPNGLAAGIVLARAGVDVTLYERADVPGGGLCSAELTLPGFLHDVCSAVHPLGVSSPFFRTLELQRHGLEWIHPPAPLAHPLDDGTAVMLERSVSETGQNLGIDGAAYRRIVGRLERNWDRLLPQVLGPPRLPADPLPVVEFGLRGLQAARAFAETKFQWVRARALFAGLAAHSLLPLEKRPSGALGLMLGVAAHAAGWPFPRGGSYRMAAALAACLKSAGGRIVTGRTILSLEELPDASMILCDLTPRQVLAIAGPRLRPSFREKLERYRYGPGAFKLDWALDGPIPWKAPGCGRAGTVHLGGTLEEIAASERAAWENRPSERPFVLLSQPSLFDPTRAPHGKHTAWAYCHVPHSSDADMTARVEAQVERFAPGFRSRILARSVLPPAALQQHNPNLVGGDINGGVQDLGQLFLRPTVLTYSTPTRGLYLCSSSTPPGGGVHGMCGYFAAIRALRDFGL